MYSPVKIHKLSATQMRKLKKGDKVIIKKGNDEEINLSPEQAKKFERKSKVGAGLTIQLDPYQQDQLSGKGMQTAGMCCSNCGVEMEIEGEGLKQFVGKVKRAGIGKKIIKFAKDTKLAKKVGNALIERAVKTIAGSGAESVKRKRGRPPKGGALLPAGGSLLPAGMNRL